MIVTYAEFITAFPEFGDQSRYPEEQYTFWANEAEIALSLPRFGARAPMASMLYCAHNLVLATQAAQAASKGGVPGSAVGAVASKSVDKISVSYNNSVVTEAAKKAGQWALTSYGLRLWQLMRVAGGGPRYVPGYSPAASAKGF